MKKYYAVNGKDVRIIELRETPKFLISSNEHYGKFKKIENPKSEVIASSRRVSGWSYTGYEIYELTSEKPKQIIREKKEEYYVFNVKQELEKRIKNIKTFEEALSLNDLLGLGVKHPHSNDGRG